jgi:rhamnose transport system ATP-binding protein
MNRTDEAMAQQEHVNISAPSTQSSPHIELVGISHHYAGVRALDDVTITIQHGTVHSLVGENGAGKSTLGKIIAGVISPSEGEVRVSGEHVHFANPREALGAGVALVHQEIALVPALSVFDNVFLGAKLRGSRRGRRDEQRRRLRDLMDETSLELDPDAKVANLRVAEQQLVEILRALARNAELIVMDEPTAPLSPAEVEPLKDVIRGLRDRGKTVVYISHKLEEVLELSDTISVLKDGALVAEMSAEGASDDHLITAMLGRPLATTFPKKTPPLEGAPVVLSCDGLCCEDAIEDVSFTVREGEIVGLAGLVGSGRTEVARAIFGADPVDSGTVELRGRRLNLHSCRQAVKAGIALLPEDRKTQGLVMGASVRENITMATLPTVMRVGVLNKRAEAATATRLMELVDVRGTGIDQPVSSLSGGNQQKVALGKWLNKSPSLLILDEPTRGVDIGAKRSIYELVNKLAAEGAAVLMISSDLLEIMGLSHRILVMHRGRMSSELDGSASEEQILTAAFGRQTNRKEA